MNRLQNFTRLYAVVIGAVSSVSSVLVLDSVQKAFSSRGLAYVILLALIGCLSVTIAWVIETSVNHSTWLRHVLTGSEFVEGIWWDMTLSDSGGPPHGTVMVIQDGENGLLVPPRDAASWDCAGTRSVVVRATLRTAWKSWKPWRVPPSSRRHCCAPGPGPRALACRGWHCRTPPGGGARPAPGSAIERTLPAPAVIVPRRSYAPGAERATGRAA